ncbi:hypothetical protein [Anaerotardibacter muris]|uniref:hypothetical protein n=1 Tax=Anaerotardibacter muris TaxID=2941505 RepID=UPI00203DC38C|nr:hypothetical protein [Anaerotardibacter muris]
MSADSYNPSNSGRSSFFADDFDPSASPFDSQATPAFGFPVVSGDEAPDYSGASNKADRSKGDQKSMNNAGKGSSNKGSNPPSSTNNSSNGSKNAQGSNNGAPNSSNNTPNPNKGKNKKNSKANDRSNANANANAHAKGSANTMKDNANNYDFLWEDDKQRRSAKGDAGTTTVVESDTDYLLLPHPDIFNSYPPEVQRKIMEWADRDVRARRDDESLRQDALVRARASRERTAVTVPVAIIILCIVCAAVTGIVTRSALFVIAFLAIALAIILSVYFTKKNDLFAYSEEYEEEDETEEE